MSVCSVCSKSSLPNSSPQNHCPTSRHLADSDTPGPAQTTTAAAAAADYDDNPVASRLVCGQAASVQPAVIAPVGPILRADEELFTIDPHMADELLSVFRSFLDDPVQSLVVSRGAKVLASGSATVVLLVSHLGSNFVVKRYGPLFYLRIDAAVAGLADAHASRHGAGPRVVYHVRGRGHVMEFVEGRELSEKDVLTADWALLGALARATAAIHAVPTPAELAGSPMLFRGMAKLLDGLSMHQPIAMDAATPTTLPTLALLCEEVLSVQSLVQSVNPILVFGHGDLKPRNMMLHKGRICVIDFEVSGPTYLAFDIASIFRPQVRVAGSVDAGGLAGATAAVDVIPREQAMRCFLEAHLALLTDARLVELTGTSNRSTALQRLFLESQLFEPLTWLESTVITLAWAVADPPNALQQLVRCAVRWAMYQETKYMIADAVRALTAL
jgi:thiamine kinase-like enzyme